MATRPTNKPDFALTATGTDIQQPDSSHQNAGWAFREKPPYEYANWLAKNYYDWTDWLDQEMEILRAGWYKKGNSDFGTPDSEPTGLLSTSDMALTRFQYHKITGTDWLGYIALNMNFSLSAAAKYVYAELPTGILSLATNWAYSNSTGAVPIICWLTTGALIPDIFGRVVKEGSAHILAISNKQLLNAKPTSDVFTTTGVVHVIHGLVPVIVDVG